MLRHGRFQPRMWRGRFAPSGDPYGRTFLADASTGLLLPGFTYTRSGPDLWCPQADGSLKSFAANVIPREWANGRWGFRFDPGWSQVARFTHDLSSAAWSRSALLPVVSGALGVNGQADSFALIEDTSTAIHFMYQTYAATAGQSYTHKYVLAPHTAGQARLATIFMGGPAFNADCWLTVNPATGEKVAQGAGLLRSDVEQLAGGYWSVSVSATAVATNAGAWHSLRVHPLGSSYLNTHTGDGMSGVRCYAVNFTNTSYPVPLTVAQGTAGTVGNFSAGLDASALPFALAGGFSFGGADSVLSRLANQYPSVINFRPDSTAGGTETVEVYIPPTSNQLFALVRTGGTDSYGQNYVSTQPTNRFAVRAAPNSFRSAFNGQLQTEDTAGAMPVTNYIQIGRNGTANLGAMLIHDLWVTKRLLAGPDLSVLSV